MFEQVTSITWFGTVYAFHKPLRDLLSVNLYRITCSKISNIP